MTSLTTPSLRRVMSRTASSTVHRVILIRQGGRMFSVVARNTRSLCPASKASLASMTPCLASMASMENIAWGRRALHSARRQGSRRASSESSHSKKKALGKWEKNIHSSASASHSVGAATCAAHLMEENAPTQIYKAVTKDARTVGMPTAPQLRTLFVSSAVPMIGFGFMDNFIMIQAGGYIDATIGVKMGLATLTAAAMGQVVSDVSGVVFGGTLERFFHRTGIIKPSNLSTAQRHLPICRNVSMAGAVLGVMLGCALGATSLLCLDLDAHERQKRTAELQHILTSMLKEDEEDGDLMGCEGCTVYMLDEAGFHPGGLTDPGDDAAPQIVSLHTADKGSYAARCARSGFVLIDNHIDEASHTGKSDWKSVLCAPVRSGAGNVVAVVEFKNKKADPGETSHFTENDERLAKMLARHVGIFLDRMGSE